MKGKNKKIVLLVIIILLVIGGIVVWKWNQKKETKSSDTSSTTPLNELSDKELEKCLLEDFSRRLELEKYFVFNLGKEVETRKKVRTEYVNYRAVKSQLENDLSKLAVKYRNKLKAEGKKVVEGTDPKKIIVFLGKNFQDLSDEWTDESFLEQKITNGSNLFIVFEKDDSFEKVYLHETRIDQEGNSYFPWNNWISLRMKVPTTYICEGKEKALEVLKNDPALVGKK